MSHKVDLLWDRYGSFCKHRAENNPDGDLYAELAGLTNIVDRLKSGSPSSSSDALEDDKWIDLAYPKHVEEKMPTNTTQFNESDASSSSDSLDDVCDNVSVSTEVTKNSSNSMYNPVRRYSGIAYKAFHDWFKLAKKGQR